MLFGFFAKTTSYNNHNFLSLACLIHQAGP